ncbi:hypothetical protein N9Z79_03850 [Akkermansiaceae bacterium]|nr:hypothetical protein [bacterium]MDB4383207.1 hypothetical protein [Akkermansiaceae bacterium]
MTPAMENARADFLSRLEIRYRRIMTEAKINDSRESAVSGEAICFSGRGTPGITLTID